MKNRSHPPLVYIVLVNWNGWQETAECLRSLERQDYSCSQTIVVDNASSDESARSIGTLFPQIHLFLNPRNLGFSGGCNVGIREAIARGAEYVWLLNNDTKVDPKALRALVDMAESDDRIGAVGSVLYWMDQPSRVQVWGGGWVSFWTGRSGHHSASVPEKLLHYITGASMLIRTSALQHVGLLDEQAFFMYWEDTDLCFRLRRRGWRLAVAQGSVILHKQLASTGRDSPSLAFFGAKSSLRFFRRYSPCPAWTLTMGIAGRVLKQLLRRERQQLLAVIRGTREGARV